MIGLKISKVWPCLKGKYLNRLGLKEDTKLANKNKDCFLNS